MPYVHILIVDIQQNIRVLLFKYFQEQMRPNGSHFPTCGWKKMYTYVSSFDHIR